MGDLEYVILGTVVEPGVSVDVLFNPDMIEGPLTLDLRSIPKEVRTKIIFYGSNKRF